MRQASPDFAPFSSMCNDTSGVQDWYSSGVGVLLLSLCVKVFGKTLSLLCINTVWCVVGIKKSSLGMMNPPPLLPAPCPQDWSKRHSK